jgi:hypothetical protein
MITAGLIEKELRQNSLMILLLGMMLTLSLIMILNTAKLSSSMGSSLELAKTILSIAMVLGGYVQANFIIASEFRQKTQIFLEGLPLPRWRMLAVKYVLGLLSMVGVALLLVAAAWWQARSHEATTQRFLLLVLSKAALWAWFCWAVSFAIGFLGRYRALVTLTLVFVLAYLESQGWGVGRWAAFSLIDGRFAYERWTWPVAAMQATGLVIAACTVLGFYLGLVRDSTIAAMLAEKMSARERMLVALTCIAALVAAASLDQRKKSIATVHLPGALDVQKGVASVSVAAAVTQTTPEEDAAMKAHAEAHAAELNEVAQWMGRDALPPVYLVHRRDFAADESEWSDLDSRQGIMLRLNVLKRSPQDLQLRTDLLHSLLRAAHHYRLPNDSGGWIIDGFAYWWPRREQEPTLLKDTSAVSAEDLAHWLAFRKLTEEDKAMRHGAAGMVVLGQIGQAQRRAFVSALLGRKVPHNGLAVLRDLWKPVEPLYQQHLGMSREDFAAKLKTALGGQKP